MLILSTTGKEISFLLNKERNLTIKPDDAVEVSESEFKILNSRLGRQIKALKPIKPMEESEKVTPEETPEEKIEATPEESTEATPEEMNEETPEDETENA